MTSLRQAPARRERLESRFGAALTVDVEEWYHTCWVPEYVDPARRPDLRGELDRTLPVTLDLLAEHGSRATFFVLGEVAERHPELIRRVARDGHEVASHGWLHLRANERDPEELRADLERSRTFLEDLVGAQVLGFRAPEWSLRSASNPRLRMVAEEGYRYDASLAPYPGAGRYSNPRSPCRFAWRAEAAEKRLTLYEFPPLTFGGPLRLPAGSWTGRKAGPGRVIASARRALSRGGMPVLTVHPWELVEGAAPGPLSGMARFIQEAGRTGYLGRFGEILGALEWTSIREASGLFPC